MNPTIVLTKYQATPNAKDLFNAIDAIDGFSGLKPQDTVLIKPNLVAWDDQFKIAPFGVYTTTRLVEDLIICLKEWGVQAITIGEGSVEIKKGMGTLKAYEGLGYQKIAKKYGVHLVDFNTSDPLKFPIDNDIDLHIAKEAIETDFFINFPVLKTHGQTKISLGLKNLKGCLKLKSKKACHHKEATLEQNFSFIADFVNPQLTLIDGIYGLEKGALHFGNAYRKDLIIASRDPLGADLVGAKVMGFEGTDIAHFKAYADRHQKSLDLSAYELIGDPLETHIKPLKWDWSWTDDNTGPRIFQKFGITGVGLPKYDETLCSGCSPIANMANILVLSAFKGTPLPKVEFLNGKKMTARPGYDQTVLLGNCMIKANKNHPNIKEAVPVKGCPPSEEDVVKAMQSVGLEVNEGVYHQFMQEQGAKYDGKEGYEAHLYDASL